ncbi:Uncharacterised protein [Mycobacterium tuberculosis]|uniref:Uncharacterized protein n=1 Tax=Mycobacterium tuberculosis TaxID=1773 RepID=A0A916LGY2_MYCTX|nr:Uncharacterised protein [Mycobacterium tuberculosis]CPB17269.1 Uncharacterised protein [Mycobacterium tuberculosis]
MISSPEAGSTPTTRGSDSSLSASSRVTVCRSMLRSNEPVRGLGPAAFWRFLTP